MANINISHLVEFTVFGDARGQAILNVTHWRPRTEAASGVWTGSIDDCAAALREAWRTTIMNVLPVQYKVNRFVTKTISNASTPAPGDTPRPIYVDVHVQIGDPTDVGELVGDAVPTFNAVGVQKRTGKAGRKGRGAIRIGPVRESDTIDNEITPVFRAQVQTAAEAFFEVLSLPGIVDSKLDPVIYNKTAHFENPLELATKHSTAITSVYTRPYVSSQVSRKQGSIFGL